MRPLPALFLVAFAACTAHLSPPVGAPEAHPEPIVTSNGAVVVRARRIEAQTIRAHTVYAERVEANGGAVEQTFFDEKDRDWGEDALNVDVVEADVIYAKEINADWIEAEEIHAKEISVGR